VAVADPGRDVGRLGAQSHAEVDLGRLLDPRSIAIVGVSSGPGVGAFVLQNLRNYGYDGTIRLVNPKYEQLHGLPCHASLTAIGEPIDCVVIAIGGEGAVRIVEEAARVGAGAAIVLAAGFAETGEDGVLLEERLAEAARRGNMALLGPNCIGIVNTHSGAAAFGAAVAPGLQRGPVAAIVQSGSVAIALSNPARELPLGYIVSTGNEAVVSSAECLEYVLADPRVSTVSMFIEGVREPERFLRCAERALTLEKPIVALKAGRSELGRRSTVAHTASLAGSDRVFDAVCKRNGIARVSDLDQLLETSKLFASGRLPSGDGLAVMTLSGGEATVLLDIASDLGLRIPALRPDTLARLREVLPSFAPIGNPLDGTGVAANDTSVLARCVELLAADDAVDAVLIADDANEGARYAAFAGRAIADIAPGIDKPIVWCSPFSRGVDPELRRLLAEAGVPFLYGLQEGMTALAHAFAYRRALRRRGEQPEPVDAARAAEAYALLAGASGHLVAEAAEGVLALYGLTPLPSGRADGIGQAIECAQACGYPVALKLEADELLHKTELAAVRLGLGDAAAVERAAGELAAIASAARLERWRYQVQPMASGVELLLGLARDPQFGHVVTIGFGGVLVEAVGDVAMRPIPVTMGDAREMIGELRANRLLTGFRGLPAVDLDELARAVVAVSSLAVECGDLVEELDVNPLIATGTGLRVVDALIVKSGGGSPE
jgi:acyl-CoA synthetase (NDP forming)